MTTEIAEFANTARLQAMLDALNLGAGVARVRLYNSLRPLNISIPPTSAPLVELPLLKPAGIVSAGLLTLAPGTPSQNAGTGAAQWGQVVNGAGDVVIRCDVGAVNSSAEIWISAGGAAGVTLFEGGETSLVSGTFS